MRRGRKNDDAVIKKALKNVLPQARPSPRVQPPHPFALLQVDCTPPEQAMKYSKWRSSFRNRMEKKGIKKTKATEIMVSSSPTLTPDSALTCFLCHPFFPLFPQPTIANPRLHDSRFPPSLCQLGSL